MMMDQAHAAADFMDMDEKKDPVCAIVLGMASYGKSSLVQVR